MGIRLKCSCLISSHEEADHIIVQQYQGENVRIISDDTYNVLVLLPHLYVYDMCARALQMSSPVANRSIVDRGQEFRRTRTRQRPSC